MIWKQYAGHLAWPTLALVAALLVCDVALVTAGVLRVIPLWVAGLLLVPVAYGWFTPLHEAVHGNVGGTKARAWLDQGVGWLSALAYAAPFSAFQAVHLRHHGTVNKAGRDPDLWVKGGTPLAVAARCLTIVPHYYWRFMGEMRNESVAMRVAVRRAVVAMSLLAVVVGSLAWAGFALEILVLWVLPGWLASGILSFAFDWLPHHPHDDTGRYTNARVLRGGPVLTVLMAGQDAHLVHHLWPKVPFYRYITVFHATRAELEANGSPIVELLGSRPPERTPAG
ncbi:MAG: fatty acid desaturase [Myxococcota bacterium]